MISSPETACGSEYGTQGEFCKPHCGPSASVHSFKRNTWGFFSAVCFLHGRELLRKTGRPQGMMESCWGGTSIQSWSSPEALAACGNPYPGPQSDDGDHFSAAMIQPLLNVSIRGAVWYQGEENAGSVASGNAYACQMKALVNDWRSKWNTAPGNKDFPFIIHQLSAYPGKVGVPAVRWSQYGVAHGPTKLPNVGLSVGTDLSDPDSPCGAVHIRNKTAIGDRTARCALTLSYNKSIASSGPLVKKVSVRLVRFRLCLTPS